MRFKSFLLGFVLIISGCATKVEPSQKVKNIILMIGDGMGLSQVYAAYTADKGNLNLEKATYIGLSKTYSASDYITDSGAGGTAISCGVKTRNHSVGVDPDGLPLKTILESVEEHGLSTGLIATSSITHATPAAFIAHRISRDENLQIAEDFISSDIDIFIGGGRKFFEDNESKINVSDILRSKGYEIVYKLDDVNPDDTLNTGCLAADDELPKMLEGRGNFLPEATAIALTKLSRNKKGFFIMIEGSQIDWGGHDNDIDYVVTETLDFDRAIGVAFNFADKNPGTLVIVTADHETGGLSITGGNLATGKISTHFSVRDHTAVMVPVFAYGTGAEEFAGMYDNTEIYHKMMKSYEFGE
jgi:alkaline phosphatase